MRKALKVATLMGLTAALIVPAVPSKAADMSMGNTKVTIGGQVRERLDWYPNLNVPGTDTGKDVIGSYRARLKIQAKLSDGVTAVFTPQAYGVWGQGGQGLYPGDNSNVSMHEAYMLLANPFGINNVIVKLGRQEVNLGNQRLVGSEDWSQSGRSLDGILVGYVAGNYGLAGFFYGKLNETSYQPGTWYVPTDVSNGLNSDIDLYVATWQGQFKPFGIGGTYELTDIFVQPTLKDLNVNTLYGRVTPTFDTSVAKVKANLEGAYQSGNANKALTTDGKKDDFSGYFFSVGAGADFTNVSMKPTAFLGYDYYSGDSDNKGDIDTFWSLLPSSHEWNGHADVLGTGNVYMYDLGGLLATVTKRSPGLEDLYLKLGANPMNRLNVGLDFHYFKTAEDYAVGTGVKPAGYTGSTSDDVGWESDLAFNYKYTKNLCLSLGWNHFDPKSDFGKTYLSGNDDATDQVWAQADLKF